MANSAAGFNPTVIWTSALQDTWNRMVSENHPLMLDLIAGVNSGVAYPADGLRELIYYHITGNTTYANTAYTRIFDNAYKPPGAGGTRVPNANDTREESIAKLVAYWWLYDWMDDDKKAAARAYMIYWADLSVGYKSINTSDTDQNSTVFCYAAMDLDFGTNYLSKTTPSGMILGNGGNIPRNTANYFQNHLTPTGTNNSSAINECYYYIAILSKGGLYPPSSEYTITEAVLFLLSWAVLRDRLAVNGYPDYFPVDQSEFYADQRTALCHQITPDHKMRVQWGDDENARSLRPFQVLIWLAWAGANDEVQNIINAGAAARVYPRYFFNCNPYDTSSSPRPSFYYDDGQRTMTFKTATDHFQVRLAPDNLFVDHRLPDFLDNWQLYVNDGNNGEWAIGCPILYGYSYDSRNNMRMYGISSMANRTLLGTWDSTDWCAIRARTDGKWANNGGTIYNTPEYASNIRDVVYLANQRAIVIRDRVNIIDSPRNLANYRNYPSSAFWPAIVTNTETPSATRITVRRSIGGTTLPFGTTTAYCIEVLTGVRAGEIAWSSARGQILDGDPDPTNPALPHYYYLEFPPGALTGALNVGDTLNIRNDTRSSANAWDLIYLAESAINFQWQCRANPTISGSNSEYASYDTPTYNRNVRLARLSPTLVDSVAIVNNQSYTRPDGIVSSQGLIASGINVNEQNYWPRRISSRINSIGQHEIIHVVSVAANSGEQPSVALATGVGAVVGNRLVIFTDDNIEVVEAVSPILYTATIDITGSTLTCLFDAAVRGLSSGNPIAPTLSLTGGSITATYSSGNASTSLVFSLSRLVEKGETGTLSFAANSFELVSDGTDNVPLSARPISNLSTVDTVRPTASSGTLANDGTTLTIIFSEPVVPGGSGSLGLTLTSTNGAVTCTYTGGTGTNTFTFSLSRSIVIGETITRSYSTGTITDIAGNALVAFTNQSITNNSAINPAEAAAPIIASTSTGNDLAATGILVCNVPIGTTTGDLLIAHLEIDTTSVNTAPAQFGTAKSNINISTIRSVLYERVVQNGDPTTYTWTTNQLSGVYRQSKVEISRITNFASATARVYDGIAYSTGATHTAKSITTTAINSRIIRYSSLKAANNITLPTPQNYSLVYSTRGTSGTAEIGCSVFKTSQVDIGPSGTLDMVFSSSTASVEQVVAIAPFVDTAPPIVTSASIDKSGQYFELLFDKPIRANNASVPNGFLIASKALSYYSGVGINLLRFTITPRVEEGESLAYTYAPGNIEDTNGNDLEQINSTSITNNSTYPIVVTIEVLASGNLLKVTTDRTVSGWLASQWSLVASGGSVLVSSIFSTGTDSCTFTLSRQIARSETVTASSPEGYVIDGDGVRTDALTNEHVENNSEFSSGSTSYLLLKVGSQFLTIGREE